MMKWISLSLFSFLLFLLLTFFTCTFEAHHDGFDKFGFPFTFYSNLGGKSDDRSLYNSFNIFYLFFDIFICFIFIFFLNSLLKIFFPRPIALQTIIKTKTNLKS